MKLKTRLVKEVPVPAQLFPQTPRKLFWTRVTAVAFVLLNLIVRSWCLPHLLYGSTVGHSLLHRTLFRKAFRNLCGGGDAFKSLKLGQAENKMEKWKGTPGMCQTKRQVRCGKFGTAGN